MTNVTVQLSKPIQHAGQTVSELTFREPTVGDLIAASDESNALKQTMTMLTRLCGLDRDSFGQISTNDLKVIVAQTKSIMGNAQPPAIGSE